MDATDSEVLLAVGASEESPLKNPCFVMQNWDKGKINLTMNGTSLIRGKDFRYGFVPTIEGHKLVIWIQTVATQAVSISIENTINENI